MSVTLSYVVMVLVWASTPLAIKISMESVDSVYAAMARLVLGASLGAILMLVLRVRLPVGRAAWRTYAIGNTNVFVGVYLTFLGAQHLPSGMVSVLFGLSPVLSALLARFFVDEKPLTRVQWVATLLGLVGLVVVFREQMAISPQHRLAVLYVLASVLCFCLNNLLLKRWPGEMPTLAQTTGTLLLGVPLYAVLNYCIGSHGPTPTASLDAGFWHYLTQGVELSSRSLYAILYLGLFGSLLGVMCYFHALKYLSASTVALATLITPVLALLLGRTFNAEVLTRGEMFGAGGIILALLLYHWHSLVPAKLRKIEVKHGIV